MPCRRAKSRTMLIIRHLGGEEIGAPLQGSWISATPQAMWALALKKPG